MLIEFSVENFRSIRDRQTLSLVANNAEKGLSDNVINVDLPGLAGVSLLKGAAIYGANASGKTNLLLAMKFMEEFVSSSATDMKPEQTISVVPFRLDEACSGLPSEFEVVFVHKEVRYRYGFAADSTRVRSEWLYSYPQGKPRRMFERTYIDQEERHHFESGQSFKKGKDLESKTRQNALYVSVGAQFDHEQLTDVYSWFETYLRTINLSVEGEGISSYVTAAGMKKSKTVREFILSALKHADIGIENAVVRTKPFREADFPFPDDLSEDARERLLNKFREVELLNVTFGHRAGSDRELIQFAYEDESAGTQKFFTLLGPLQATLTYGYTVFMDEIGASMHPLLTRELIKLINSERMNTTGAQLIFTTHDATLLDGDLLRRDQVWFTEKDYDGATKLVPLSAYKPRKNEALQKGYLAGRYGAIPLLTGDLGSE